MLERQREGSKGRNARTNTRAGIRKRTMGGLRDGLRWGRSWNARVRTAFFLCGFAKSGGVNEIAHSIRRRDCRRRGYRDARPFECADPRFHPFRALTRAAGRRCGRRACSVGLGSRLASRLASLGMGSALGMARRLASLGMGSTLGLGWPSIRLRTWRALLVDAVGRPPVWLGLKRPVVDARVNEPRGNSRGVSRAHHEGEMTNTVAWARRRLRRPFCFCSLSTCESCLTAFRTASAGAASRFALTRSPRLGAVPRPPRPRGPRPALRLPLELAPKALEKSVRIIDDADVGGRVPEVKARNSAGRLCASH